MYMDWIGIFLNALRVVPAWDVLVVFVFLVSGFFYGIFFGRARMLALTASIYIGIAFLSAFANISVPFPGISSFGLRAGIFIVSLSLAHIILYMSLLRGRRWTQEKWWQMFVLSFLSMGLIASTLARLLPAYTQTMFTDITKTAFLSDAAYGIWLVLPLMAMLLASKKVE